MFAAKIAEGRIEPRMTSHAPEAQHDALHREA